MSVFKTDGLGFYLQNAYVRDWIENSMIFLEVEDVASCWKELVALDLTSKYERVKQTPIRHYDWGRECFLHDPSGVLWHFGEFFKKETIFMDCLENVFSLVQKDNASQTIEHIL